MKTKFLNYFLSAIIGLCLYFVLYLPIEYYFTEIQLSFSKIPPLINTGVLCLFLSIANLFDFKNIIKSKGKTILLILFIFISFIYYGYYLQTKVKHEYVPKIISVYPTRFIQGQLIEIDGLNFGPIYDKGKVIINETEFIAKEWDDKKIIIEAPVPDKFGTFYLYVKTKDGKVSNQIPIEILNPNYLRGN